MAICSASSTRRQQETFGGRKFWEDHFHKLVFDHKKYGNFWLTKISLCAPVLAQGRTTKHSSLGTTPWSVYLLLPHVTWHHCTWKNFQAFSLLFTYWKQSNTGGCESLGRAKTRLNRQTFKGKIMFTRDLFLINTHPTCNLARWLRRKVQAFGVAERRMRGGEMLPTLGVDWQASAVRDDEAKCFCKVAGMSIDTAGRWSAVDTFNHR